MINMYTALGIRGKTYASAQFPQAVVYAKSALETHASKVLSKVLSAEKPNICQRLLTTSPNSPILLSAAVNGQAVRQAAVPFPCMIRHLCMGVADVAGGGGVISVGITRVSRSLSLLLLHAAAIAIVMLLDTATGVVVSVAIEVISLVVLVQAQRRTTLVNTSHPCFVMVDVRVPLHVPCALLSLLLLLLLSAAILSVLLLLVLPL